MPDFVPQGLTEVEEFVPKGLTLVEEVPPEPVGPIVYDGLTAPETEEKAGQIFDAAIDADVLLSEAEFYPSITDPQSIPQKAKEESELSTVAPWGNIDIPEPFRKPPPTNDGQLKFEAPPLDGRGFWAWLWEEQIVGDRLAPLPPDADRIEKVDRAVRSALGGPLRVLLKTSKGLTLNAPDVLWASLKRIVPDEVWDEEVKNMTLDQAMDWAAGYNPSGFESMLGEVGEFAGRLKTVAPLLVKYGIVGNAGRTLGVLEKAAETALTFGAAGATEQVAAFASEHIDPTEAEYGYEGATAVLRDMAIGAVFSLAESGIKGAWSRLTPSETARALKVLGLKKGATPKQIDDAVRSAVKGTHPDKTLNLSPETQKGLRLEFEKVIAARNTLRTNPNQDIIFRGQKVKFTPKLLEGEKFVAGKIVKPAEVVEKPAAAPVKPITKPKTTLSPPKPTLVPAPTQKPTPAELDPAKITAKRVQDKWRMTQDGHFVGFTSAENINGSLIPEKQAITNFVQEKQSQEKATTERLVRAETKKLGPVPSRVQKLSDENLQAMLERAIAEPKAKGPARRQQLAEKKKLVREDKIRVKEEASGIKRREATNIRKGVEEQIKATGQYEVAKEAIETQKQRFGGVRYYVPKGQSTEIDEMLAGEKGFSAELKSLFTHDKNKGRALDDAIAEDLARITGETPRAEVGADDPDAFFREVQRFVEGDPLTETLDGLTTSEDPLDRMLATKWEMINDGGFSIDEINGALLEIGVNHDMSASDIQKQLLKGGKDVATKIKGLSEAVRSAKEEVAVTKEETEQAVEKIDDDFSDFLDFEAEKPKRPLTDLLGRPIKPTKKELKFGEQEGLGLKVEKQFAAKVKPELVSAISNMLNKPKGPTSPNQAFSKLKEERPETWTDLFENFNKPQAEMEAAFQDAIKGDSIFGGREAGFVNIEPIQKTADAMLSLLEPAKLAARDVGADATAKVITTMHRSDVANIEFNEKEFENLDGNLEKFQEALATYSDKVLNLLMLSRGSPANVKARNIRDEALRQLKKEAPELVGTRLMVNRIADFNYDFLTDVVGDRVGYVEDYFYGLYEDPRKVQNLLDHWKTTDRFTKQKKWPTYADAKSFDPDIKLRNANPVANLRSEYLGIARLSGMIDLKDSLLASGTGEYIDTIEAAPPGWEMVQDPVFRGLRLKPSLARMINSLISTNKVTRNALLNPIRQANNLLRNLKFIGSMFHLGVIVEQSVVDTGIADVLVDPTAGLKGLTVGFRASDPIFKTAEYKQYIENGGGHRFSIEADAQRSFNQAVAKLNKAGTIAAKAIALPLTIPQKITSWMFESYIPKVKYQKYLVNVRTKEVKLGRSLTDAERQEIIKEGQNFYGEMNERLFGRSGTVTTLLRFKFMAPGWFEGNLRSVLKATTQWGQGDTFSAHRSRRNIVNSFILALTTGTIGTLIMTGKPPKMPEKLEDIPDLFKIDTGEVDAKGEKIMLDTMKTGKDYWLLTGNIVKGPSRFIGDAFGRFGGMNAVTWDVMSDINQMSQGKAVYDWKGDRVVEITDPFIEQVLKLGLHELEKLQPISTSVFTQARRQGLEPMLAAAMSLAGIRLTKTEQAKREAEVLGKIFSLRDQQERLFFYLGSINDPRGAIKKYNSTVMRILNNPNVPLEVVEKFEDKLIIDENRLVSNRVHGLLSEAARNAELMADPKSSKKDIRESNEVIAKNTKWLKNFKVPNSEFRKQIQQYELLHRKVIKQIKPEDLREDLKDDLAQFYAEKDFLGWDKRSGDAMPAGIRKLRTYEKLASGISQLSTAIDKTTSTSQRSAFFDRIEQVLQRTSQ